MEILRPTHDLRRGRESEKSDGIGPFQIVRKPLRWKVTRSQNKTPRLLLANYDQRLQEIHTKMRKMPKARAHHPSTCEGPLVHFISVSLYAMVHGYRRTFTQFKTETLPFGPYGFLFEVGRTRILRKYQRRTSRELRMEEHYHQARGPLRNCNRQQISVHLYPI